MQVPHAIDVALERGRTKPRLDYPPTRFFWFSGPAFHEGIEVHELDGVPVRIYGPEKIDPSGPEKIDPSVVQIDPSVFEAHDADAWGWMCGDVARVSQALLRGTPAPPVVPAGVARRNATELGSPSCLRRSQRCTKGRPITAVLARVART
jgi:hypothetical protein